MVDVWVQTWYVEMIQILHGAFMSILMLVAQQEWLAQLHAKKTKCPAGEDMIWTVVPCKTGACL